MERKPEHLKEDPTLRHEYVGQQSFDEFCAQEGYIFFQDGWKEELTARGMVPDAAFDYFKSEWMATLDPSTKYDELLYLTGMTDRATRVAATEQELMRLREGLVNVGMFTQEELDQAIREQAIKEGE